MKIWEYISTLKVEKIEWKKQQQQNNWGDVIINDYIGLSALVSQFVEIKTKSWHMITT